MSGAISPDRFVARLDSVQSSVARAGLGALLVGVGPDLEWLVGYRAIGHERLNLLVVPPRGRPTFISPRLERAAAEEAPGLGSGTVGILTWEETDDPFRLVPALLTPATAPAAADGPGSRVLVSDGLRAAFLLGLQGVMPDAHWGLASAVLSDLRRSKDTEELALMRAASAAADRVIEAVAHGPLEGRAESDVAREVRERLIDEGHDTAEFAIVAAGSHSASPHHEASARIIRGGHPLLLDIGGRYAGYCSDTTRTFWVAGQADVPPDPEFVAIYRLTEEAQAAARAAVRPGLAYASLDDVARAVITRGGHGEHFMHRLGHGIGLEVHEEPYVVSGSPHALRVGDTFSIEPGIYLDGRFGVRIEDVMVATADGGESLNTTPRGLRSVRG